MNSLDDQDIIKQSGNPKKKAFGTQEWAAHNVNIQTGCEHGCLYCYAQCMGIRFKRVAATSWTTPRIRQSVISKKYRKMNGVVMFPTTHDIMESNLVDCLIVLNKMLHAGNQVLIVSKPHLSCIQHLCEELKDYRQQILFRFTIGSSDDAILSFWEPNAPAYLERLESLKWAKQLGFRTSVSSEPMLDGNIDSVIQDSKPFVTDSIWLGRMNRIGNILSLNAPTNVLARSKANELMALQTDQWVKALYVRYTDDPVIKFKDSIKKVVGIERPTEMGLDV